MKTINHMLKTLAGASVIGASLVLGSCSDNFTATKAPTGTTLWQAISAKDSLAAFAAAAQLAGLKDQLNSVNAGQFTVLAPTNNAFLKYLKTIGYSITGVVTPADAVTATTNIINTKVSANSAILSFGGANSTKNLVSTLDYHVIGSPLLLSSITGPLTYVTMSGARLSFSNTSGGQYVINADFSAANLYSGANIVDTGTNASNGTLYTVDAVMNPLSVTSIADKSLLNFALNYGVTPIGVSMQSGSSGTTSTVNLSRDGNGDINVANAPTSSLWNLFSVALVRSTVTQTLVPNGATYAPDFTVLVPTDAAMMTYLGVANVAAGVTKINSMAVSDLANLVNYHIISGRLVSTDLTNGQSLTTLLTGKTVTVGVAGSAYTVTDGKSNNANVTTTNKLSNAGVVHVINKVLLPQ